MLIRAGALLLPLLATPAFAQADLTNADHLAAVVIGFAGGGTAMVHGSETASVTRDGPGKFSGTIEETGNALTFEIVEPTPCQFEATYPSDAGLFRLGIDVPKIKAFVFEQQEAAAGYTFFGLTLEAAEGAVQNIMPDGTRGDAGTTNRIGSSLTLDELNAAAAALQAACPAA